MKSDLNLVQPCCVSRLCKNLPGRIERRQGVLLGMLAPALVLVAVLFVYPVIDVLLRSMGGWSTQL